MDWKCSALSVASSLLVCLANAAPGAEEKSATSAPGADKKSTSAALDFKVKDIDGKEIHLGSFQGKVLMVVNVASKCGLTEKQYASLESLHKKYKDRGFEILAFPANNFGNQEPGKESEIKAFCATKGVSFKLLGKISVKGDDIHPFYKYLTSKETGGKHAGDIQWNFQKFLIGRDGKVIARFEPREDPLSKAVTEAVEKALQASEE